MAKGTGGIGSALNWVQQQGSKISQAIKKGQGTNHARFGDISEAEAKTHVNSAKNSSSYTKKTILTTRKTSHIPVSTPLPSTSPPASHLKTGSDSTDKHLNQLRLSLLQLKTQRSNQSLKVQEALEKKKAAVKQFSNASKKAGLSYQEALKSPKFDIYKQKFLQAADQHSRRTDILNSLSNMIKSMESQINQIEKVQNLKAEHELQKLLKGN